MQAVPDLTTGSGELKVELELNNQGKQTAVGRLELVLMDEQGQTVLKARLPFKGVAAKAQKNLNWQRTCFEKPNAVGGQTSTATRHIA